MGEAGHAAAIDALLDGSISSAFAITERMAPLTNGSLTNGVDRAVPIKQHHRMRSIFGSKSEHKAFNRLKTMWDRHVDVFPQQPLRVVLGYDTINKIALPQGARDYLLTAEFDFVVCDKAGIPLLAIEFDGIGGGYSRDGKYIPQRKLEDDPHRKLKLDRKLRAADEAGLPAVVVSFAETEMHAGEELTITALDVLVGQVLEFREADALLTKSANGICEAAMENPLGEKHGVMMDEIAVLAEKENPVRQRIRAYQRFLPVHFGEQYFPLHDRPNYVGAVRRIYGGLDVEENRCSEQILLESRVYVRCLGSRSNAFFLANMLAEYVLAKKALRTVGTDPETWRRLREQTPWTTNRVPEA